MIDDLTIKKTAQTLSAYTKGCQYYKNGRVKMLRRSAMPHTFQATVAGSKLYTTVVEFNEHLQLSDFNCNCPAYHNYIYGGCKHIIAVLKQLQQDWTSWFGEARTIPLTTPAKELLAFFRQAAAPVTPTAARGIVRLVPAYTVTLSMHRREHTLEFLIGSDRLYVVKDIPLLLTAIESQQEMVFGKQFTLQPGMQFGPNAGKLLELLQQIHREEKQRQAWGYGTLNSQSAFSNPRFVRLTDANLLRFLAIMEHLPFTAVINGYTHKDVSIKAGRPPVKLKVTAIKGGIRMALQTDNTPLYGLDTNYQYIFHGETIYKPDEHFSRYLKPLVHAIRESKQQELDIPATAVADFVSTALPLMETIAPVQVEPVLYERFYKQSLEAAVYLDKWQDGMSAKVLFSYGEITFNPLLAPQPDHPGLQGKWLLRSTAEENRILDLFRHHGFREEGERFVQPDEEMTYLFLRQGLLDLKDAVEVYYADDFRGHVRPPVKASAAVRLNTGTGLLEFTLSHDETSPQELLDLLHSYKLKKRYHRLKDGSFVALDNPEFQTMATLIDQLQLRPADLAKDVIILPKHRALYLDALAREETDFAIERSSAFKKMVQDIREPQDIDYPLPEGLTGRLRGYQKTGYKWLKSLAVYGLGGILADDMGLGKTLQVLTFLLAEKQANPQPSLVVAPTSLIYNWREEAAKFTPGLKVAVISGQQTDRLEQLQSIHEADLVVTSYGLLRRDIEFYEEIPFQYCFLDEAQHVKNHQTVSAQAVKRIKAGSYFALTGTPIENNLTELWSIFDFILPGYLASHAAFSSRFEVPIVKHGDKQAMTELGRHIKPFILRRMKKAVLKELPPKMESKIVSEMTEEQSKLYKAWLVKAKQEFESEVASQGFAKSQIKILSLLTRLRQLCCHPALFLENYEGGSGKLDLLLEIVSDAVGSGHRLLLFSQFTGMLDIIRRQLDSAGWSYFYLDGATKAEDRLNMVQAFNNGDKNLFLISLKAGGTGLNLTGADVVIHYDPWWNPAVEEQATDRAYRIGQKNSVQVYKLITKDTIEEKIYHLQQQKKELIDSLIKPGENFLTKMSEAEIRNLFQ